MAIHAALAGQGVVLAQYSMVADELAQGRLIMPFAHGLPLPSAYFLVGAKGAFDRAQFVATFIAGWWPGAGTDGGESAVAGEYII